MIIAVPEQRIGEFHPYGGTGPLRPPYKQAITWWHWWCTTCRRATKPGVAFSGPAAALEMGGHHEERAQCQVLGQLELFAVGGAR